MPLILLCIKDITLTKSLPIDDFLPEITQLLTANNTLVLQADPGAGKSTKVPLSLLKANIGAGKKIVMLEPRRLAAKSIATYLAGQLGEKVGQSVGYQVKNDNTCSKTTLLEIVTEGILTRRIQHDPELADIGLIIFDEFHERSIHADLSLTLGLEIQQALRDDLKILVMSATIDTAAISEFLSSAPVVICPGRVFPVQTTYLPRPMPTTGRYSYLETLKKTAATAFREHQGDILIFLPGKAEINKAIETLAVDYRDLDVLLLPLYGELSADKQQQAILPDGKGRRKLVFTTNVAETSLTIEGIRCVIDTGLSKRSLYDPSSGMTRLVSCMVSKASAEQRKGRAGRLSEGNCYRLWTESQHRQLADYYEEEIKVVDLASLVLELAMWGVKQISELSWLTPPPATHFQQAKNLLTEVGLLDEDGAITETGQQGISLGIEPRFAKMLMQGKKWQQLTLACDLAALLSERDIFTGGQGADLNARLVALQDYRLQRTKAREQHPLATFSAEQALQNSRNWQRKLGGDKQARAYTLADIHQYSGQLLALAYPDRIAKRRPGHAANFQLANGKGAMLFEDDSLAEEAFLVAPQVDGQKTQGRIYLAAPVALEAIKSLFSDQLEQKSQYSYDKEKNKISGTVEHKLGALVLGRQTITKPDQAAIETCLLAAVKETKLAILPWDKSCQSWLDRARWLALYDSSFEVFTEQIMLEQLSLWLQPYLSGITSVAELKKINLLSILKQTLDWSKQEELEQQAPQYYLTPSDKKVKITYSPQHNPKVSVVLQEVFGELASPLLAWGKAPLCFELLSPAKRPIQVTSDLNHFWQNSYFEVAKDMRGRYPKHRWPEQPLLEKAGRSIKTRRS
ncbi:ATP-dependent helicase HrpB [Thalassomonas haliotis]|uniref:ATP-dependent helicase HrpB n=1 Tax=Thalassomonas haliotis TaxID=485448 RepID=A0ABY7VBT2_9GAMM|nr:ATP-dependent helicase HrpB [Thalassomonas haliotis]